MDDHFREGQLGRLGGQLLASSSRNCEFSTQLFLDALVFGDEAKRHCIAAAVGSRLALIMLIISSRIRRSTCSGQHGHLRLSCLV